MPTTLRSALLGALLLAPAGALAQGLVELAPPMQDTAVIVDEPLVVEEPVIIEEQVVVEEPVVVEERLVVEEPIVTQQPVLVVPAFGPSGLIEDDARMIAMANGLMTVEEVDTNWNGNFEVEGEDASGDNMEITIDAETGAVLDIDD